MAEIIFVEGVSGVGKSTMVQNLSEGLSKKGHKVKSYLEFDYKNPIDFYCTACVPQDIYEELCSTYHSEILKLQKHAIMTKHAVLVRYYDGDTPLFSKSLMLKLRDREFCYKPINPVSLSCYTEIYQEVWKQFAESMDENIDYYIFDGSLLHHPINDMMRNYNVSFEYVVLHIQTLLSALGEIKWSVFYLYAKDIETQLKKAHIDRKQSPPSHAEVEFWQARYEKDMYVLKNGICEYSSFNISEKSWNEAKESIMSALA